MRFAVSDGERVEATPGARGSCPGCGSELIAKCGSKRIHHWAHKGQRHCDHWWENETQWHRDWKSQFPSEWQEIASRDENGELHIADIKTPAGWAIEFQHSYITRQEALERSQFHRQIIWVIDGKRRVRDTKQFSNAIRDAARHRFNEMVFQMHYVEFTRILDEWVGLGPTVVFDFGHDYDYVLGPGAEAERMLWVLRATERWSDGHLRSVFGYFIPLEEFVKRVSGGKDLPRITFDDVRPTGVDYS